MGTINVGRWVMGGVVAGILIWIIEALASALYMEQMQAAMEAHGLSMEMSAGVWVLSVVVSLLAGLVLVFFYVAARPRFGPGPRTAVIVAVALFVGGYLLSLVGYHMLGLFPDTMLVTWGIIGLVEWILATLAGGWIYRES
ncbi:MAG: hypothetical protein V3T81_03410 [Thermoanaerobaculia bacterium]